MGMLTRADVLTQSRTVFKQFGEDVWKPNARHNASLAGRKNAAELRNCGLGKFAVLCAMGESLEDAIEPLKKYRDRVDIIACDKAFGTLVEHGIIPDMVLLADASIPFSWLEPYVKATEGVKLVGTAYCNPQWTDAWLGPKYFYVNVDSIDSQKVFGPIMGDGTLTIPAGSNVSNAMLCFLSGCIDDKIQNFANHEKYLLVGYDYSWRPNGNYYAFNNPAPKRNYMTHMALHDINGDQVRTSENLMFSAKWLWMYLTRYNVLPVVNCSGRGLLDVPRKANLEDELKRIKNDPAARRRVVDTYHAAKVAQVAFEKAQDDFGTAKEALWQ